MWPETQRRFADALGDSDHPIPEGFVGRFGQPPIKRFGVYRNNVAVGLRDALAATYPVVAALVGDDFFRDMAGTYARQSPPETPVLLDYGESFGDFLSDFEATRALPYLADVARLEWVWNRAYHAADATPMEIDVLAGMAPSALDDLRLLFHPSLRLLSSPWPVVSIWQAHQGDDPATALAALPETGERAMVLRPELEVFVRSLDLSAFTLVSDLARGEPLGTVLQTDDAGTLLAGLFETGAVVGIT